jgi:hypothetical protein
MLLDSYHVPARSGCGLRLMSFMFCGTHFLAMIRITFGHAVAESLEREAFLARVITEHGA